MYKIIDLNIFIGFGNVRCYIKLSKCIHIYNFPSYFIYFDLFQEATSDCLQFYIAVSYSYKIQF